MMWLQVSFFSACYCAWLKDSLHVCLALSDPLMCNELGLVWCGGGVNC